MKEPRWTLEKRFWRICHHIVNTIAWKYVPTKNVDDPRNKHWIWRLNRWVADHYTLWFIEELIDRDKLNEIITYLKEKEANE